MAAGTDPVLREPGHPGAPTADDEFENWRRSTRIFLRPIAAPSILGLFGFAGATFMTAAFLAGWWGTAPTDLIYIAPFCLTFGGIAQFIAGIASYFARDGLGTAMHGMWGTFWIAFGILQILIAAGTIGAPVATEASGVGFGYWFIVLAMITLMGAIAASAENLGITSVLFTLAIGSVFAALYYIGGGSWPEAAAGWAFLVSSWCAVYTASAMMLEGSFGRVILPLGKWVSKDANVPGHQWKRTVDYGRGEPGVRAGQ